MNLVVRQSIKGAVINYLGAFIGFLSTFFILTKFLSKEEIGLMRVMNEAALLLAGFAQLGVTSSALRFFPYFKNEQKKNNGFFFYLMAIPLVGCAVFLPLFAFLSEPLSAYFSKNSQLFVDYYDWVIPLAFALVYLGVFETYASAQMRIAIPKFIREVLIRVLLIGLYLLYGFDVIHVTGLIVGNTIIFLFAMLANLYYLSRITSVSLKHDPTFVSPSLRNDARNYTLILMIGAIGGSIVSKIDIFMISSEMGLDYTAVYTIAFFMVATIDIPARSITAISAPMAATALKSGDFVEANRIYRNVALHQFIAGSFVFLFIWININNIFDIIPNGEGFEQGKWVFFFLGLSKLVEVSLAFGTNLISYSRFYHWGLYFVFFISAVTVVSNYLLIPIYGITGAALATTLTCLISYGSQQWLVFTKLKSNPYSIPLFKQLLLVTCCVLANIFIPSWSNPWLDGIVRTGLIAVVALPAFYFLQISKDANLLISGSLKKLLRK